MKIWSVTIFDTGKNGGVTNHINNLSKGFAYLKHEPLTISLGKLLSKFPRIEKIKKNRDINFYIRAKKILKRLVCLRIWFLGIPKIILFHDVIAFNSLYEYCQDKKIIPILIVHSYFTDELVADAKIKRGSKVYRFLINEEKEAYGNAPLIFAVSKRTKHYLISNFMIKSDKIYSISNFTDTDMFCKSPARAAKKAIDFGDKKIIFCPRKLNNKYGVKYAIEAMRYLKEYRLVITGGGSSSGNKETIGIIDEYQKSGNLTILGEIKNNLMPRYYQAADFVIIPSIVINNLAEGTSISAIEAQSCGRVVIASRVGGLKDIIINRQTGILIEEKSAVAITEAIRMLERKPTLKKRIEQKSYLFAKKHYSFKVRARELVAIIKQFFQL